MRALLCALVILAPSSALAERIYVEAASADYSTRDGMFRLVAIMSGHPSLGDDSIGVHFTRFDDTYMLMNLTRTGDPPRFVRDATLRLSYESEGYRGNHLAIVPYTIEDRGGKCYFSAEFDGSLMGIPSLLASGGDGLMTFAVSLAHDGFSDTTGGQTTVDNPMFVTPEPSSVVLASLGGVLLLAHLFRTPRLRVRRAKRHIVREPPIECIGAV